MHFSLLSSSGISGTTRAHNNQIPACVAHTSERKKHQNVASETRGTCQRHDQRGFLWTFSASSSSVFPSDNSPIVSAIFMVHELWIHIWECHGSAQAFSNGISSSDTAGSPLVVCSREALFSLRQCGGQHNPQSRELAMGSGTVVGVLDVRDILPVRVEGTNMVSSMEVQPKILLKPCNFWFFLQPTAIYIVNGSFLDEIPFGFSTDMKILVLVFLQCSVPQASAKSMGFTLFFHISPIL